MPDANYMVLTVDDDLSARVLFKLMLERNDFAVIQAEDAYEALELLENTKPDLIMTDISLPGMNGIEFTAALRKRDDMNLIPIVVLSAFHNQEMIDKALTAGADQFYKKPLTLDNLRERLEEIIRNRQDKK